MVILDVLVDGLLVADGERVAGAAARKLEHVLTGYLQCLMDMMTNYYETIPQYDS